MNKQFKEQVKKYKWVAISQSGTGVMFESKQQATLYKQNQKSLWNIEVLIRKLEKEQK
ncbi:MAG: hypothetical protein HRT98_04420 [Mycoplasmatales bacterium]|nr:hypothetical protein [Mycoplasmatales bacterium]